MSWSQIENYNFLGNSMEEWIVALAIFIICATILYSMYFLVVKFLNKLSKKTENEVDDFLVHNIMNIKHSIVLLLSSYISIQFLNISTSTENLIVKLISIFITIRITVFLQKFFVSKFKKLILHSLTNLNRKLQKRIEPVLGKVISSIIWIIAISLIVNNLGYNLTSLIAGLGIGGLFIGLAAQDTLSNFFSSLAVFLDQPFDVGDLVRVNGITGTVEDFGIRSTRIRTLDGTLMVITNNQMASDMINNVTNRKGVETRLNLGVTYDTSADKMKKALSIVKDTLKSHVHIQERFRVHFVDFGDSALKIEVRYLIEVLESYSKVQSVREDVNMRIKNLFEQEGIEFAFPTQTLYVKKD